MFGNMLVWGNQIKNTLAMPTSEYGLEVEFYQRGSSVRIGASLDNPHWIHLSSHKENTANLDSLFPEISNMKFPLYSIENEDLTPSTELLTMFYQDLKNWLGKEADSDAEFIITEQ